MTVLKPGQKKRNSLPVFRIRSPESELQLPLFKEAREEHVGGNELDEMSTDSIAATDKCIQKLPIFAEMLAIIVKFTVQSHLVQTKLF